MNWGEQGSELGDGQEQQTEPYGEHNSCEKGQYHPENPILNLSGEHLQLLKYTDNLFSRQSLRKNTYLFKHLKNSGNGIEMPIYVLAEERKILQITQSYQTLIEALKMSESIHVSQDDRTITIIDYPTLKVKPVLCSSNDQVGEINRSALAVVEKLIKDYIYVAFNRAQNSRPNHEQGYNFLKTKPPEYTISKQANEEGYYYVTLRIERKEEKDKDKKYHKRNPSAKNLLKEIVDQYNASNSQASIDYQAEDMFEEIKNSIQKVKKAKKEFSSTYGQNNNNNYYYQQKQPTQQANNSYYHYEGRSKMNIQEGMLMMNRIITMQQQQKQFGGFESSHVLPPYPTTFIRKAEESSDEETGDKALEVSQSEEKEKKEREREREKEKEEKEKKDKDQDKDKNKNKDKEDVRMEKQDKEDVRMGKEGRQREENGNRKNKGKKEKNTQGQKNNGKKLNPSKVLIDEKDFPSIG